MDLGNHRGLVPAHSKSVDRHTDQITAIAVSGGVDSMALAKLCVDLKASNIVESRIDFAQHALIVDHKARDGSGTEANHVRSRLESMGTMK